MVLSADVEPRVEPRYQYFPEMAADDYRQLRDSIAAHGFDANEAILLDEDGRILDGHHRAKVCADLGITPVYRTLDGLTEAQKDALIWRRNLVRRHLTLEQKRDLIRHRLKANPEVSDRSVARDVKVSPTTVGSIRRDMVATGQIGQTVRPHQRTDEGLREPREPHYEDPSGTDAADHLSTVRCRVYIEYSEPSTETRMRGNLPYPRESKRKERRIEDIALPAHVAATGRDGYKELAMTLAQRVYRDLCERPIKGVSV